MSSSLPVSSNLPHSLVIPVKSYRPQVDSKVTIFDNVMSIPAQCPNNIRPIQRMFLCPFQFPLYFSQNQPSLGERLQNYTNSANLLILRRDRQHCLVQANNQDYNVVNPAKEDLT